jgi:hypothetical protein
MERSLLEIWNGPQWHQIREKHKTGKRRDMLLCGSCNADIVDEKNYTTFEDLEPEKVCISR